MVSNQSKQKTDSGSRQLILKAAKKVEVSAGKFIIKLFGYTTAKDGKPCSENVILRDQDGNEIKSIVSDENKNGLFEYIFDTLSEKDYNKPTTLEFTAEAVIDGKLIGPVICKVELPISEPEPKHKPNPTQFKIKDFILSHPKETVLPENEDMLGLPVQQSNGAFEVRLKHGPRIGVWAEVTVVEGNKPVENTVICFYGEDPQKPIARQATGIDGRAIVWLTFNRRFENQVMTITAQIEDQVEKSRKNVLLVQDFGKGKKRFVRIIIHNWFEHWSEIAGRAIWILGVFFATMFLLSFNEGRAMGLFLGLFSALIWYFFSLEKKKILRWATIGFPIIGFVYPEFFTNSFRLAALMLIPGLLTFVIEELSYAPVSTTENKIEWKKQLNPYPKWIIIGGLFMSLFHLFMAVASVFPSYYSGSDIPDLILYEEKTWFGKHLLLSVNWLIAALLNGILATPGELAAIFSKRGKVMEHLGSITIVKEGYDQIKKLTGYMRGGKVGGK